MARGMVSAPQPLAVEAGVEILRRGGNAVDAAVATAFVQGVVDPQMCGLGGGGAVTVRDGRSGEVRVCGFYPRAPLGATADMFAHGIIGEGAWGGFILKDRVNEVGYLSLCTPAAPRGLSSLHSSYGALSWREVVAPAIAIADEGPPVYHHVYDRWVRHAAGFADSVTRHAATPACARQYMRDGQMLAPGERMDTADYAKTLARLAEAGAEDFHTGAIAERIAADVQAHGGLVAREDLRAVEPTWSEPVRGGYRGWQIFGPPPPGAGVAIIAILNVLSAYQLSALRHGTPEHLHVLASAIRAGLTDWKAHTGDPAFMDSPVAWLTSEERAAVLRATIGEAFVPLPHQVPDGRDTTQVTVIDSEGNAASMTHTLGLGSGVVTDGLGFMYNNSMMLFDPRPGQVNSVAPGRIRQHAISACLLRRDDGSLVGVGAPGGHGIVAGVVQTISNIVDFGMTPTEAVSAPRIHCESRVIEAEARVTRGTVRALEARGHEVRHSVYSYDYQSGRPHVVRLDGGKLTGGADPRGGGMALTD
jgi:gamma-glutamyltranspeptidase/glutathione hydrolase